MNSNEYDFAEIDGICWGEECPKCEELYEVTVSIEVTYRTTNIR